MLKHIEVKNYALIKDLTIDLNKGLNIITGETGAGKSILLGALGLIMGKRADSKVLYDDTAKCMVEAKFESKTTEIKSFFENHDYEYEGEITIRREISTNGKSRAFINDSPATLDVVQSLTELLIDLHQQFDTLAMFKPKFQLEAIDALAGIDKEKNAYHNLFLDYKSKEKQLVDLKSMSLAAAKELDFLSFQHNELNEIKLIPNEQYELESKLETLENADDIQRIMALVATTFYNSDPSITDKIKAIQRDLSSITKIGPQYQALYDRIQATVEELKDIASESEQISESVDADPAQLHQVQERLNQIFKLQKKHGVSDVASLMKIENDLAQKLNAYQNNDQNIELLTIELEGLKKQLVVLAQDLSQKRSKNIPTFESQVNAMLATLSMPNARLKVDVSLAKELLPTGQDMIQFMFATNKGSDYLPLKEVASGGELSRLTLCIKAALAEKMQLATMIFDEIDTGVSGEVASKMGNILKAMAKNTQMISITHSPQIASKADCHFWVYKQDNATRTTSHIKVLHGDDRIVEIAKMLSGSNPGKAAMDNAKELISQN